MRAGAALKHSAGHRSKDKNKFDELAENSFETKKEDGEDLIQPPKFVLCPFLQSSYDAPGQLLLAIAERNSSNSVKPDRRTSHRLQSESLNSSTDLTRGLVQKNSNPHERMSWNNREAVVSISPWSLSDYLDETRRPSVNSRPTSLSSDARHRQKNRPNPLETTIASNRSNQTTAANNKKRWEYLWTGRRPTDVVAYKFHHYSDIRRYMEQYRQDHVHRGTSSPAETKNEEQYVHTSTLSICSIGAPSSEQPLQDPVRPFLAQRLPSNRQTTELDQQRKRRAKSGVSLLGFRGHLFEEDSTSLITKDIVGKEDGGVAGERCISSCCVLHPNSRGVLSCVAATVVINGISLPWCCLRVASTRDSTRTQEFLPAARKNISDLSKEKSPGVAVLPASRTARYAHAHSPCSYSYS